MTILDAKDQLWMHADGMQGKWLVHCTNFSSPTEHSLLYIWDPTAKSSPLKISIDLMTIYKHLDKWGRGFLSCKKVPLPRSLDPIWFPRVLPRMISEFWARSKPWILLGMTQQQSKQNISSCIYSCSHLGTIRSAYISTKAVLYYMTFCVHVETAVLFRLIISEEVSKQKWDSDDKSPVTHASICT